MSACAGRANYIRSLEHVQVQLSLSYSRRGDLEISLTSPMGTRSTLVAIRYGGGGPGWWRVFTAGSGRVWGGSVLAGRPAHHAAHCGSPPSHQHVASTPHPAVCPRPLDVSGQGYNNWIFMSTHFWDEDPQGLWTLGLENKGYYFNTGESYRQAGASGSGASRAPRC